MSTASGLNFFDPGTLANPYAFYEAHRSGGPVVDVSTGRRETYLVVGAAAIREILQRPDLFSSRPVGVQGVNFYPRAEAWLKEKGFGRVPHLIAMDPPRHTAFRGVLNRVLRDQRFHQMRPRIRTVASTLIDGFAPSGECEFVREYAWKLSVLVVAGLLGVDLGRIEDFKRWSDAWVRPLLQPLTEDEVIDCMSAIAELQHYLVDELNDRQRNPRGDLLSDIAHATFDLGHGEVPLRQHEQLGLCEVLMVAANDTTANALSLGMLRLVERPDIAERIRGDRALIERFAEESLRYEGAVQSNFRTLTADTEFCGASMGKGAMVLLSWAAANHDPSEFENPREFDPGRAALRSHLGFGAGIHACPGAALARQELVDSYDLLLARLGSIRLQDGMELGGVLRAGGLVTHGLSRLPIRFEVR
jgi:cytochrome P450